MKRALLVLALLATLQFTNAQFARVQVIHNSADLALAEVDIYLNDVLAFDNFMFRNASPFSDVPAGIPFDVAVAPGNSTDVGDAIFTETITFEDGESYVIVAGGIFSATGYDPAPPLSYEVFINAREVALNPANVDILVFHGSTDAPPIDIVETSPGSGTLVDDLSYTDFQGYLDLPTLDYIVELRDETGSTGIVAYEAPLLSENLAGSALTVLASGFLDPSQNSNGPGFGLFVASPLGGELIELLLAPLGIEDSEVTSFNIYPNPVDKVLQISGDNFNSDDLMIKVIDIQGRQVLESKLDNTNKSINVESLTSGAYLVQIFEGSKLLSSKKLLKN